MQCGRMILAIAMGAAVCGLRSPHARAESAAVAVSALDVARAEQYAADAFDAYGRKAYAEAIALYERAYSIAPNGDVILYNIARIYDVGLHSRSLAIDYYRRYTAAPGAT